MIQFTDRDFKVDFNEDGYLISHKKTGKLALTGVRKGSMFVVNMDSSNKEKVCCFYSKAFDQECMM